MFQKLFIALRDATGESVCLEYKKGFKVILPFSSEVAYTFKLTDMKRYK
jgi:hypothetical protein